VTFEPACEVELKQHGAHNRRRCSGHPDQVVEQYGAWPEQADDARAIAGLGLRSQGLIIRLIPNSIGRPMIGSTALMMSDASVVSVAPCFMRSLVPAARGSSGEPGTANTSRPCSAAIRAVISDPERCAASTAIRGSVTVELDDDGADRLSGLLARPVRAGTTQVKLAVTG